MLIVTIMLALIHKNVPYLEVGAKEFLAADFFVVGYYYKKSEFKIHDNFYIVPVGGFMITFGTHFYQATLLNFKWWQVIPYIITAIVGILMVFNISKKIVPQNALWTQWLVYIGNNTLTILTWHMLSFKLVSLIVILVYQLPIARLAEFPVIEEYSKQGWFLLYFLMGVLVPIGMSKVKYLR